MSFAIYYKLVFMWTNRRLIAIRWSIFHCDGSRMKSLLLGKSSYVILTKYLFPAHNEVSCLITCLCLPNMVVRQQYKKHLALLKVFFLIKIANGRLAFSTKWLQFWICFNPIVSCLCGQHFKALCVHVPDKRPVPNGRQCDYASF